MAKVPKRTANIVIKSQFNINGSRGDNVGGFVADYVAREEASETSMAYVPPVGRPVIPGDGIAFTLDRTAISKQETLRLADKVEEHHQTGNRAIQQLVISFSPEYLVNQGIVPEGEEIHNRGDYKHNYDDIRLRHAIISGVQSMIENEGYHEGKMVAAIQSDTLHLHAHAVVYEDFPEIARKYGGEERGIIRESSLNRLSFNIDRALENSKDLSVVPTPKLLSPEIEEENTVRVFEMVEVEEPEFVNHFLMILEEEEKEKELKKQAEEQKEKAEKEQESQEDRGVEQKQEIEDTSQSVEEETQIEL